MLSLAIAAATVFIELTAEPSRLHSDFVNGIKKMPVRFTPRARSN